MLKAGKGPLARAESLIEAWRTFAPDQILFGMSLPQFQAVTKSGYEVRDELADLGKRTRGTRARKRDIDLAISDATQNAIHAIKAEPALGENCPMYAALGYTRRNDRYASRRRARKPVEVIAAPNGGVKQDASGEGSKS